MQPRWIVLRSRMANVRDGVGYPSRRSMIPCVQGRSRFHGDRFDALDPPSSRPPAKHLERGVRAAQPTAVPMSAVDIAHRRMGLLWRIQNPNIGAGDRSISIQARRRPRSCLTSSSPLGVATSWGSTSTFRDSSRVPGRETASRRARSNPEVHAGRIRVDLPARGERRSVLAMAAKVVEHVRQRVPHGTRRGQRSRVVTVGEYRSASADTVASPQCTIDPLRSRDQELLHAAASRSLFSASTSR